MTDREEPLARVVETLREPVRIEPDFTARVMAEIALEPAPGAAKQLVPARFAWARRRWTIQLSPLGALATAAGLAAMVLVGSRIAARGEPSDRLLGAEMSQSIPTQFILLAPRAASVTVVGDFNDWNPAATPLAREKNGSLWWVTVSLPPGRYRYAFVVDGTIWLPDPDASAVEEEFGRPSSVVTIGGA